MNELLFKWQFSEYEEYHSYRTTFKYLSHKKNQFFFEEVYKELSVLDRGYVMIQGALIRHQLFTELYSW